MTEKEGKIKVKEYTKQVMHNAVAHQLLTNAQPVPEQRPLSHVGCQKELS